MSARHEQEDVSSGIASRMTAVNIGNPKVSSRPITDPQMLDRGRVYAEAWRQTKPMAAAGSTDAASLADLLQDGTARRDGLSRATAERLATADRPIESLTRGANPGGKAAEVVLAADYMSLHAGQDPGIVNAPEKVATNVLDIRIAPDCASRKDMIFGFESHDGKIVWKYNGQVKTGDSKYMADSLVKMADQPGYGKVAYVDARFVNADGTPRVADDAFTPGQAAKLQKAKVRLRGIADLEKRADQLLADLKAGKADGLDPVARAELEGLRDDIAAAYRGRGIIGRIGSGAAVGAASAAIISLLIQLAISREVDVESLSKSAGVGAAYGAASAVLDAAFYHFASHVLDKTPEAAQQFAQQGVPVLFCALSAVIDIVAEVRAARRGEITAADAVAGASTKIALDLLPLLTAPLGLFGLPVLLGAQLGGRLLISKLRDEDRRLKAVRAEDAMALQAIAERELAAAAACIQSDKHGRRNTTVTLDHLSERAAGVSQVVQETLAECAAIDALYAQAFARNPSRQLDRIRLITN